jgi:hypothetical protein
MFYGLVALPIKNKTNAYNTFKCKKKTNLLRNLFFWAMTLHFNAMQ